MDKTSEIFSAQFSADDAMLCATCGSHIVAGQAFCSKCGSKCSQDLLTGGDGVTCQPAANQNKKMINRPISFLLAGVFLVAVVACLIIVLGNSNGSSRDKNFNNMFAAYGGIPYCSFSPDGTWMKFDTNPEDIDSDDVTGVVALKFALQANEIQEAMISYINSTLGFGSDLIEDMQETSWSQGEQTQSNEMYTVTWTYHPNRGLEIMYMFNS